MYDICDLLLKKYNLYKISNIRVRGVMDVVFSVCTVTRGAVGARV